MNAFPNWAKNILFLLVLMLSGLTLIIVIEGLMSGNELIPLNTAIERIISSLRTPLLTNFIVLITNIGSPFALSCFALFVASWLFLKGDMYDAVLFIVAMIISVAALVVLKNTFQISRPASTVLDFTGWSFPSGHATVATAFFFSLSLTLFDKFQTILSRTYLIVGSILGTLLVSFSRLYLGAHWALDILAGLALGLLSVSFTVLVFNVFFDKFRSERKKIGL